MRSTKFNDIKKYKPVTASLRHRIITTKPIKKYKIKKLSMSLQNHAGRNNTGRITTRHHGGRHKRQLRVIDFKRLEGKYSESILMNMEYDPNRSGFIGRYITKKLKMYYILAPLKASRYIMGKCNPMDKKYNDGDTLKIKDIPVGSKIYNIQRRKNSMPDSCRSAGSYSILLSKTENNGIIRLPSKKLIEVDLNNYATIGQVSHDNYKLTVKGKAGANRWLGKRPTVRGYAMNPVDHPHGGKTKGGKQPLTKWGKQAKWIKTRAKNKKE